VPKKHPNSIITTSPNRTKPIAPSQQKISVLYHHSGTGRAVQNHRLARAGSADDFDDDVAERGLIRMVKRA
jgi:hypothetical protein